MPTLQALRRTVMASGLVAVLALSCGEGGVSKQSGSGGGDAGGASGIGAAGASGTPAAGGSGGTSGSSNGGSTAGTALGGGAGTGGTPAGGAAGAGGSAAGTSGDAGVSGMGTGGGAGGDAGSGGTAMGGIGGVSGMGGAPGGSSGTGGGAGRSYGGGGAGGSGGVPSLYQKYANHFPIGAAVDANSYMTHASVLTRHFNSITAENEMKFDALQPTEGNFTYTTADRIVSFAQTNNMRVRGHALVWHRQTPAWMFSNGSGGTASRDQLLTRMRTHITNVMRHFQGKVYAWDVVNEAMMNDGQYRTGNETPEDQRSSWYAIAGESYIAEAFRAAAAADPSAKLFYNDYYDHIAAKRDGIFDMLKGLLDSGVTVHGVGIQAHLSIAPSTDMNHQGYYQTVANIEAAIEKYASLGLEVQITEMDVSLYIPGVTYTTETYYTAATFTEAVKIQQAERYRAFFDMFRANADKLTGVTLWGVADDNTWLSELSSMRTDFPLLFDTSRQPKHAFWAVVDF